MATKALSVLEDVMPKFPMEPAPASFFESTSTPPGNEPLSGQLLMPHPELDNYQIALVPLQHSQDRALADRLQGMRQLLLLPLTWKDLMNRLSRVAGQFRPFDEASVMRFGEVRIDFLSMEVSRSDRPVTLTAMEFKVLKFLVSNPRRVISRDELLNEVWGYENYPCTRTVDNHILKLRQKLETDPSNPVHFRTVHGTGYKFTV
jgi:two-component system, OmpR family, alkaline phosphatase synthesis response regulator PhoP